MPFNSIEFIFVFLPVSVAICLLADRVSLRIRNAVLLLLSFFFYAFAGWGFAAYLAGAVILNFLIAARMARSRGGWRRALFLLALFANVGVLAVAKYQAFFITNVNRLFSTDWHMLELVAPLGISFFTFSFVAYAVDLYRREIPMAGTVDYALYVLYFPKLLMGPIVEPRIFLDQLAAGRRGDARTIAHGLQLFFFGLFKKAVVADALIGVVSYGFNPNAVHSSVDAALSTLAYTFEIYFDFSGYTDMAIGVSKMFGIDLPVNFDSPYRALSVRDFWKRWHLTLTQFFTKYVYFPLGGSRRGPVRTYCNILAVFLISGLWHGANWTFVLWGCLHGLLMVRDRMMERFDRRLPSLVRWGGMFAATNVLWCLFRSSDWSNFKLMIRNLLRFDFTVDEKLLGAATGAFPLCALLLLAFFICLVPANTGRRKFQMTRASVLVTLVAAVWGVCSLGNGGTFVYFNF